MCTILSPAIPLSDFKISKIHVLYIVNLVSKIACHDIVKMQKKRYTLTLFREMFVLFISVCLYCSVNMNMCRTTVQTFCIYRLITMLYCM